MLLHTMPTYRNASTGVIPRQGLVQVDPNVYSWSYGHGSGAPNLDPCCLNQRVGTWLTAPPKLHCPIERKQPPKGKWTLLVHQSFSALALWTFGAR